MQTRPRALDAFFAAASRWLRTYLPRLSASDAVYSIWVLAKCRRYDDPFVCSAANRITSQVLKLPKKPTAAAVSTSKGAAASGPGNGVIHSGAAGSIPKDATGNVEMGSSLHPKALAAVGVEDWSRLVWACGVLTFRDERLLTLAVEVLEEKVSCCLFLSFR